MYRLQVKMHFDAAHFIKDYPGICSRMHGHRWEVEAVVEGMELKDMNMMVDFGAVKQHLGLLVNKLDHQQINEVLSEPNVTAEYLAKWFFDNLYSMIGMWRYAELVRITVWESPDCCVKYYGGGSTK